MKAEIKAKWIAALRSGDYSQGYGQLRTAGGDFCCLGVLCDLYHKENSDARWIGEEFFTPAPDTCERMELPKAVMAWAEIAQSNPNAGANSLAEWNDGEGDEREPKPFGEIAALIEAHL